MTIASADLLNLGNRSTELSCPRITFDFLILIRPSPFHVQFLSFVQATLASSAIACKEYANDTTALFSPKITSFCLFKLQTAKDNKKSSNWTNEVHMRQRLLQESAIHLHLIIISCNSCQCRFVPCQRYFLQIFFCLNMWNKYIQTRETNIEEGAIT
jgi:hypothetical protein